MKLYILRHGHSPSVGEARVKRDAERPLSDRGRADVRAAAELLAKEGGRVDAIFASPLKRAQQTAEEAATVLKPEHGVTTYGPLSNEISGAALLNNLRRDAAQLSSLLVVGHLPQLGELVAAAAGQAVELKPAGLAAVELDGESGRLLFSRNP